MNDQSRGRHTVTKEYLDGLEAERRTPEAKLTLEMDGGTGQAARDAAQRHLEREIGKAEDRLYNETPDMTPDFDSVSEILDNYAAQEAGIETQEPPLLESYEQMPEPVPEPQYESAAAGLDTFEQAAAPTTDNSAGQAPAQGKNSGGYGH